MTNKKIARKIVTSFVSYAGESYDEMMEGFDRETQTYKGELHGAYINAYDLVALEHDINEALDSTEMSTHYNYRDTKIN